MSMEPRSSPLLTLFYDGQCPLCMKEIRYLQSLEQASRVQFEDCKAADFAQRYPELDPVALDARLHVRLASGDWLYGLEANLALWQAVGKGRYLQLLRWPGIYQISTLCYGLFARYRHRLSALFYQTARKTP